MIVLYPIFIDFFLLRDRITEIDLKNVFFLDQEMNTSKIELKNVLNNI